MRVLLVLVAVLLLCSLAGWISFSKSPDRSSIHIETNQIRSDADQVIRSGEDALHKEGDKIEYKEQAPTAIYE